MGKRYTCGICGKKGLPRRDMEKIHWNPKWCYKCWAGEELMDQDKIHFELEDFISPPRPPPPKKASKQVQKKPSAQVSQKSHGTLKTKLAKKPSKKAV